MTAPAPKCRTCDGWGFELGVPELRTCPACSGTGRPRPADKQAEQTGELIDG